MASGTYFIRACPTCGRTLEVRVELLSKDVECINCGATFTASEQPSKQHDDQHIERVLARAQRYIDSVSSFDATTADPL